MANRSADFNYKVALASGKKSLQGGRLRQAEEQFRYLVQHFPAADGGYRGLAKVLVEQEDRPAALRVLLDGGAALAKAGQRASAIAIYREATKLDPHDLAAHRRLAAALALSGEAEEAAHEYVRYIKTAIDATDLDRARLEATYALARLPGNGEIAEIANSIGAAMPKPSESTADREALMRTAFGGPAPAPAEATAQAKAETTAPGGPAAASAESPAPSPWDTPVPASVPAPATAPASAWGPPAASGGDPWAAAPASDGAEVEPLGADADANAVEAAAARYLANGDPRGGEAALEAAKRYLADGRMDAASDLLLQLIASNIAVHDAQRLLVDVARSLGKRDVAKAKVQLLVQALRLDGHTELAAEVEQLAQAL